MKNLKAIAALLLIIASTAFPQNFNFFDSYFINKTMRIDYYHIGDAVEEFITIDQIYQYGIWAGNKINLIDEFNNGRYYIKIYDAQSGTLIFSKGFDSYFGEYKTSADALDRVKHTYHETVLIPYPKSKIIFAFEKRDNANELFELQRFEIDPDDVSIRREEPKEKGVHVYEKENNDDPHSRVDIVILGEGYSVDDKKNLKKTFLILPMCFSRRNLTNRMKQSLTFTEFTNHLLKVE